MYSSLRDYEDLLVNYMWSPNDFLQIHGSNLTFILSFSFMLKYVGNSYKFSYVYIKLSIHIHNLNINKYLLNYVLTLSGITL